MKVFISSLIGGYESFRRSAREAVETLGHKPVVAEDFAASAGTPQQACLAGVREADVVVLLLGGSYGPAQPSGLSATHEEYREARDRTPVLVFVQAGVTPDSDQARFIREVEDWESGHFRASFVEPEDLEREVIRSLHEHELAHSVGPVDEGELLSRAQQLVPQRRGTIGDAQLIVVVASGPLQAALRPAELEQPDLARDIQREALFGQFPVLDPSEGTQLAIVGDALELGQRSASVLLDQTGSVRVNQALRRRDEDFRGISALIEEDIAERISLGLRFTGWLLDRIDPVRRLSDIVPVVATVGGGHMSWRTRAEHAASPNSGAMGSGGDSTVWLRPARRHRQALTHEADRLAEDLVVLLRRERRR